MGSFKACERKFWVGLHKIWLPYEILRIFLFLREKKKLLPALSLDNADINIFDSKWTVLPLKTFLWVGFLGGTKWC